MLSVIRSVSSNVNTHRIICSANALCMSSEQSERLRKAREKAGFESASEAARAFGWGVSGYIHHENGTRAFGLDAATKYGRAFRTKPGYLLGLDGIDNLRSYQSKASTILSVSGKVAAGVWRETTDLNEPIMEIDIPPPVEDARRFGVVVEGNSMDECYPDGTVLDCIDINSVTAKPQTGDHVIVERIKASGLRESTVKEFVERDGEYYLRPRSTKAEFKEVKIGKPSEGTIDGDEVRVIGFVVSNTPPAQLALLKRLGKVKDLT